MALYKKGAGQGLLYIGGAALAHDADCCCSVCNNATTVNCCLGGVSYPVGECDCINNGGYVITTTTPCVCSSTVVSCCVEGSLVSSLTDCECLSIGGVSNPASCTPIANGCWVRISITIRKRTYPTRWQQCSFGVFGGYCGIPNACVPTVSPYTELCWTGCNTYGTCVVCNSGSSYCFKSYEGSYYQIIRNEYSTGSPGTNSVTRVANSSLFNSDPCGDNPYVNVPIQETNIEIFVKRCGSYMLTDKSLENTLTSGTGCASVDGNVVFSSFNATPYTCNTPC